MYSQFQEEEQLLLEELNLELSKLVKRSKSLDLEILVKLLLLVLKCSEKRWIKVKLEITVVFFEEVLEKKRWKEERWFVSQEKLNIIQQLNVKCIFFQKKKVEDILHSLVDIDHNSMLEQQTLQ